MSSRSTMPGRLNLPAVSRTVSAKSVAASPLPYEKSKKRVPACTRTAAAG